MLTWVMRNTAFGPPLVASGRASAGQPAFKLDEERMDNVGAMLAEARTPCVGSSSGESRPVVFSVAASGNANNV